MPVPRSQPTGYAALSSSLAMKSAVCWSVMTLAANADLRPSVPLRCALTCRSQDDLLCFRRFEDVPAFHLTAEVGRADAPVVEAAADREREIAVDPSVLEEVRDGVAVTVWRADQECR
jgi:hypothetical protein